MKKVVILQKSLPQYRVAFFNGLRESLAAQGVELALYYGQSVNIEDNRGDEINLPWAIKRRNRTIHFLGIKMLWQPFLKEVLAADLVIAEQANKLLINYFLILNEKLRNKPRFAFWGHGLNLQASSNDFRNRFKKIIRNHCYWWFAYTSGVASQINAGGFPAARTTVVQNTIDTLEIQNNLRLITDADKETFKARTGLGSGPIAIFAGGLVEQKRLDLLIESAILVKARIPNFQLLILGDGPLRHLVEKTANQYDFIKYTGPLFGMQKAIAFSCSSVLTIPGLIGLAIIDSFAFETPLITTLSNKPLHSPEIEYLKDGVNGCIVQTTTHDFAEKIIELLNNQAELDRLKEACRHDAAFYTMTKMIDNFTNGVLLALENS